MNIATIKNRLGKLEDKIGDDHKIKFLFGASKKKIKKFENKGYTVVDIKIHKEKRHDN